MLDSLYANLIILNGFGIFYQEHGGYFTGVIDTRAIDPNGLRYLIFVAPKALGESRKRWKTKMTIGSGTTSKWDGWRNTNAMNNSEHPAAQFTRSLTINGYNDWYLPAVDELELLYRNFKPTIGNNYTSSNDPYDPYTGYNSGYNPSSDPVGGNYTATNPAPTSNSLFKTGGSEAFTATSYWSSSECSSSSSFTQHFVNGLQNGHYVKAYSGYVRAVRRLEF